MPADRALLLLALAAVAAGAAVEAHEPPVLPQFFQGEFVEYTAPLTGPPPYVDGLPQPPYYASRGRVYYDWTQPVPAMIEVREDYCVNIFPGFEK